MTTEIPLVPAVQRPTRHLARSPAAIALWSLLGFAGALGSLVAVDIGMHALHRREPRAHTSASAGAATPAPRPAPPRLPASASATLSTDGRSVRLHDVLCPGCVTTIAVHAKPRAPPAPSHSTASTAP